MSNEVIHVPEQTQQVSLLQTIAAAAASPTIDVDKMQRLVELQIQIQSKEAEIEFNAAMARLQPKMPRIRKNGVIEIRGTIQSKFMKYEDIDSAIRPLLSDEGFSLSFNTQFQDGKLVMSGTISHRLGHSQTSTIVLPLDNSGSKNGTQSIGSTVSYGKRYLVCMMLNVVAEGEDDDGMGGGAVISAEQKTKLWDLLQEIGVDSNLHPFLKYMGVAELGDIMARDFQRGLDALNRKKAAR